MSTNEKPAIKVQLEKREANKQFKRLRSICLANLKSSFGSRWSTLGRKKQQLILASTVTSTLDRLCGKTLAEVTANAPTQTLDEVANMSNWDLAVLVERQLAKSSGKSIDL